MKVAIVIIDYGDNHLTTECIDSLTKCSSALSWSIYLAGTRARITADNITNVMLNENKGFAYANNQAIKQAISDGCDYVVLLNNDTTVSPDFLDPLLRTLQQSGVGLVSPKIYFYPGNEYHHDEYQPHEQGKVIWYAGGIIDWANVHSYHWGVNEVDHGQFDESHETDFATGCCLAFSAQLIKKSGLMQEAYFLYWEDVDWSMRIKKAGYTIFYEPRSFIWHKNAGSSGGPGSLTHQYYQTRNRLVFGLQYAPIRTKLALIKSSITQYQTGNPTVKMAIRDGLFHKMGKRT